MAKQRELKKWNGRAGSREYGYGTFYIAAYTKKQAAELYCKATGIRNITNLDMGRALREINVYYSPCWGVPMEGIEVTQPSIYYQERYEQPKRIV